MLLLLCAGLVLGSVATLILRRNRESLLLAALCLSLTVYLAGIMLLIAKQGGVSDNVEKFLFFSRSIRRWFQFLYITFDELGMLINLGRHTFPMVTLMTGIYYTMVPFIRKRHALMLWMSALLPALTAILYREPVVLAYSTTS